MTRILFLFLFFYSNVYSVECLPKKGKQSRTYDRILKYIEKDDFFAAKQKLKKYDQDHISFYALKSHIMWKNNKLFDAQKLSEKVIDDCPVSFPICYYILAEISYQYQDYVNCSKYLKMNPNCLEKNINPLYHYIIHNFYRTDFKKENNYIKNFNHPYLNSLKKVIKDILRK